MQCWSYSVAGEEKTICGYKMNPGHFEPCSLGYKINKQKYMCFPGRNRLLVKEKPVEVM